MKTYSWGGKPVVSETHFPELETDAAILEFRDGHPREAAEAIAHHAYAEEHHAKAQAHHLLGMRQAQAVGAMEEARQHGVLYGHHLQALGHDPLEAVPDVVRQQLASEKPPAVYKFKAHPADRLIVAGDDEGEQEPKDAIPAAR